MSYSIRDIATALGAECFGDDTVRIHGVAEPADATVRDLALAMTPDHAAALPRGAARAALVRAGADWTALGLDAAIVALRPRHAMSGLTRMLDPGQGWGAGIHPSAVVDPRAHLAADVAVGPLAVICAGARIGAGSVIGPQCFVGSDARIGADAFLREAVRIGARVTIGDRFVAQPGCVVGGDGFSYATPDVSGVEQVRATLGGGTDAAGAQGWARIHSLGSVTLGDDVELGANSTIDRGTIRDTQVGNGTKIDNLVMIGHNVRIGTDCLLCGHVGIAGSTRVGNNVVLAGQTGVSDNIFIGDNVITGGGTVVLSNIPSGRVMLGYPAMKMDTAMAVFKRLRRLGRLFGDVAALKARKPAATRSAGQNG